jgi:RNase P subunit RPR2
MAEEPIRIMCPNLTCRKVLGVPKTARGKTVRCRNCGTNIRIPNESNTFPSQQAQKPPAATPDQEEAA